MKNTITILLLFVSFSSCSTLYSKPYANEDELTMSKIIEVQGSKDDLYVKANGWFVKMFTDAESVIQFQDKEAGRLMGKYTSPFTMSIYNYLIKSIIQIDIKENKVKIEFSDPQFRFISDMTGNRYVNEPYKELKNKKGILQIRQEWEQMASSLEESLKTNEEW